MADSDSDYGDLPSDVDDVVQRSSQRGASNSKQMASRSREKAQKWEAAASRSWNLADGADANLESALGDIDEANKRQRWVTSKHVVLETTNT